MWWQRRGGGGRKDGWMSGWVDGWMKEDGAAARDLNLTVQPFAVRTFDTSLCASGSQTSSVSKDIPSL